MIDLIDESIGRGSPDLYLFADLFENLWIHINRTISGSRIDHLNPIESKNGFRVLEINAASGENLGRLSMLYLKKPLPCYYLAYVEVLPFFRKRGLGNRILKQMNRFLTEKSALGILDNIIPQEEPTYSIYAKMGWKPIAEVTGETDKEGRTHYMVYIPPSLQNQDLKEPIARMLYHLNRKRPVIEMRENEVMVERTISEFRDLYEALKKYFSKELEQGVYTPLMRFLFTRFVSRFNGFRRRIGDLIGYTGGESMEQIVLSPRIASLPMQSYAPSAQRGQVVYLNEEVIAPHLPVDLLEEPARFIADLPHYARPSFLTWLRKQGRSIHDPLSIGDLMDLGFDPSRLKEITLGGRDYIMERLHARQLPDLKRDMAFFKDLALRPNVLVARGTKVRVNPPLLILRDAANAYVLRSKVEGIHWEEALEQLTLSPHLSALNRSLKLARVMRDTIQEARFLWEERLGDLWNEELQRTTWFVSWDLKNNLPRLLVDMAAPYLESIWMA